MLSEATIQKYAADNARVAAAVLKNPHGRPQHIVIWAHTVQRRQAAERAAREAEQSGQGRLWLRGAA